MTTDVPQTEGTVEAVATDKAGNTSAPTDVDYGDTTPPQAPVVNVAPNADGGLTVSGTAEAGSTVTVTYPDGSTGTTKADASGNYSVSTDVPQTSGMVEAVATDRSGNESAPTDVAYTDTTAPQSPAVNVTPIADGGLTVGGTAEPGSTVTVTYPDGSTGSTVADASGNYSVSTDVPQTSGTVEAVAKDAAGNASAPTDVNYTDTTAPDAPVVNLTPNADGGLTVSGKAEAGSTVTVTYPDGTTGSTVADASGNYSVTTDVPQNSGVVEAVATDAAGNPSQPTDVDYADTTPPTFQTFSIDLITASDNGVSSTDNITSVVTPTFTGTVTGLSATDAAQAAAGKITVMLFDDKNHDGVFDTGDVAYATNVALTMNGTTGTFNVTLPSMFDGTYNMKAVLVDASGNMSNVGLLDNNANAALVIDTGGTPSTSASVQSNDGLGYAVSSAGDVNGDGYEDFIVSAPHLQSANPLAYSSDIYVLYGGPNGMPSLSSIDNLTADKGIHIVQTSSGGGTDPEYGDQGYTLVNLGDINGDGYDDIGLANTLNNRAYVIFGRGGNSTATIDLASLEQNGSTDGFVIKNYNDGGWFGNAMSGGDINGDGYSDVLIGSLDGLGNGQYFVLYGHAGDPGSSSWSNLMGATDGLHLATGANSNTLGALITNQTVVSSTAPGYSDSDLGSTVAVIGDVNGDGYNDYIVNQPLADPATGGTNSGQVWLIFGSANGLGTAFDLKNLTPSQGIQLTGTQVGEWLGGSTRSGSSAGWYGDAAYGQSQTMSSVGDINGDGIEDFAIGSPGWNGAGAGYNAPGRVYVIYGKADGDTWSNVDLSKLDGSNGFILYSSSNTTTTNNQMGFSIASAGDVNGDGIDDFLIGAPGADSPGATNSGAVYLVYGEAGGAGFLANTDIDALVASGQAVKYTGANANDYAGTGVAGGDWNGDGISDYAYGVWESDASALNGGAYNVYTGSIAKLTQSFTVGDDVLYAGNTSPNAAAIVNGVDIISGGQGNDVIHGIGTDTTGTTALNVQHDVAMGGAGNDTIGIVGTNFTRVDGGLGVDTMKFEASGLSLNLTDYGTRVKGIENFDLGNSGQGTGGNALSLRLSDVLNMPDSLSSTVHMTISGDSSSSVTLAEGTGTGSAQWQVTGTTTVNNVAYDVYHNTSMGSNTVADLLIQHGIQVH
ncbi:hypothetical protein LMG27177_00599 [Paraburkholderia fynbosensis]|uniref:Bacterial Ig domain-containing protein n=1 Tax=Paraburkholderia fynbosensis TaxID=1200993 RepID=A0A6J5FHN5_9BURK|nr:hypothetical protein LMG27177_00599 [Paraburkholderia fynbosensis]